MIRPSIFILLALAVSACQNVPARKSRDVESKPAARLEVASPIDVAVLPIANASKKSSVPTKELRASFERALVQRRYSPLATELVDAQVVDAAFQPGAAQEDARLVISVDAWDDSLWASHTAITLTIQARLIDSHDGSELWQGTLAKRFDLGLDRDRYSTDAPLRAALCERIAAELMGALPARNPHPGHANS